MIQLPLRESQQVTLNGSGAGTVTFGPRTHREEWHIQSVAVKTSVAVTTGVCEARDYVGTDTSESSYQGGTFSGDTGDTNTCDYQIRLPNALRVVWSGGVAASTATAVITGYKLVD